MHTKHCIKIDAGFRSARSPYHPLQFETYPRYLFEGFTTTNIILLLYLAKHCIEIDVIS